jgi:hypothetical protein
VRTSLLVVALVGMFSGLAAAPALAAPPLPTVPQDCHEWNELLGIQNVMDCDWQNG